MQNFYPLAQFILIIVGTITFIGIAAVIAAQIINIKKSKNIALKVR